MEGKEEGEKERRKERRKEGRKEEGNQALQKGTVCMYTVSVHLAILYSGYVIMMKYADHNARVTLEMRSQCDLKNREIG